jgi:hypothetical protein
MITQGWPLWAVGKTTGQVWAVVGWTTPPGYTGVMPMGIELGPELDGPAAVALHGPLSFTTERPGAR